jgi:hypothetical protein
MIQPKANLSTSFKEKTAAAPASSICIITSMPIHKDVGTTMIYTHVLHRGGLGVRSPADAL